MSGPGGGDPARRRRPRRRRRAVEGGHRGKADAVERDVVRPVFKLSGSKKEFDPRFARWSRSAQLVVGMGDGSFAVYDSVSGAVFVSGRSGRHKAPITAGDWLSSLFAPALALASTSTVKVSEASRRWSGRGRR